MRKRWRMLICFVAIPLAAPFLLLLGLPLPLSQSIALMVGAAAFASWLIAYWPKRNGSEALLYAIVTGALAIPVLYAAIFGWLVFSCEAGRGCIS